LLKHPVRNIILLVVGGTVLLGLVVGESIFGYYYFKYRHIVDEKLQKPLFEQTAKIYAAPKEVRIGQKLSPLQWPRSYATRGYSGDMIATVGAWDLCAQHWQHHIQPGPSPTILAGATVSFAGYG